MSDSPISNARRLLRILNNDRPLLVRLDNYARGIQDDPYMPSSADDEYRLLAQRSKTNMCEFVLNTAMQPLFVDSFRALESQYEEMADAAWRHWQRSRMESRQSSIYRGAGTFGHSFVLTEKDSKRGVVSRGLSALRTTAIYDVPATDDNPVAALTVTAWPTDKGRGTAVMWDRKYRYDVTFRGLGDDDGVSVVSRSSHGCSENPVTRFHLLVDLEGRTTGVVEPMLDLQDRLNQTVFDLLVTQTYASFKVRTVTGMAPPFQMKALTDAEGNIIGSEPILDPATGQPIPTGVSLSAKRMMFAADPDVKFGTLDETPLEGFISSINMTMRQSAALSQTPPHHMLGEIANLSAEALEAAEQALARKVAEFQRGFGEAWERVFRIAAELEGISVEDSDDNMTGEVVWRDMGQAQLAQSGDALGKFAEGLGVPKRGLWERVPGVTKQELARWDELREEEDAELQMRAALERAAQVERPGYRDDPQAEPDPAQPAAAA